MAKAKTKMKAKKKKESWGTFLEVLNVLGGESDPDLVNLLLGFLHTLLLRRLHCVRHLFSLPFLSKTNNKLVSVRHFFSLIQQKNTSSNHLKIKIKIKMDK
jgi:hypothetical protein